LHELKEYPPALIPDRLNFSNYIEVFQKFPFGRFFLNSTIVSVIVTLGVLISSSLAGYAFAKFEFRGKRWLFLLALSTMMIPFQVRMVPMFVMMSNWGLQDTYPGLILPFVVDAFGIFLMRQFIVSIPTDLMDAARIDGASEITVFTKVILPLSTPGLTALTVITLMGTWDSFLWPLIFTNSQSMYTLPVGLALFTGRFLTHTELQMAASTIMILPIVLLYFLFKGDS
jgi:multiple sugar transport system permease protein